MCFEYSKRRPVPLSGLREINIGEQTKRVYDKSQVDKGIYHTEDE